MYVDCMSRMLCPLVRLVLSRARRTAQCNVYNTAPLEGSRRWPSARARIVLTSMTAPRPLVERSAKVLDTLRSMISHVVPRVATAIDTIEALTELSKTVTPLFQSAAFAAPSLNPFNAFFCPERVLKVPYALTNFW